MSTSESLTSALTRRAGVRFESVGSEQIRAGRFLSLSKICVAITRLGNPTRFQKGHTHHGLHDGVVSEIDSLMPLVMQFYDVKRSPLSRRSHPSRYCVLSDKPTFVYVTISSGKSDTHPKQIKKKALSAFVGYHRARKRPRNIAFSTQSFFFFKKVQDCTMNCANLILACLMVVSLPSGEQIFHRIILQLCSGTYESRRSSCKLRVVAKTKTPEN